MKAPVIMIQGTSSSVGKSLLVTGLCRLFKKLGYRVAPFKAQNMALNSYVTPDGAEIGRAQAVQADAAGIEPTAAMNPVLLKPEGDRRSQVVYMGKVVKSMSAASYHEMKPQLRQEIAACIEQLREDFDLVIIEGAGSPAEINLKANDIVNMSVAKSAKSPVLIVGDIDRGGVFASFVGTMELLDPEERDLVAGFIINKFRGDKTLLDPGLDFLEDKTGKPCFGVVPYVRNLRLAEEDSIALDRRPNSLSYSKYKIDVGVIRFPRISNYDEFDSLEHEPDAHLAYICDERSILDCDLLILPGSKCTATDLQWLKDTHLADAIVKRASLNLPIIGICGGCQILGQYVSDPNHIDSDLGYIEGLQILPHQTTMQEGKITSQAKVILERNIFGLRSGLELIGYEIHNGRLSWNGDDLKIFSITERNRVSCVASDGSAHENTMGTLIHGLFDNDEFRLGLLDYLAKVKGMERLSNHSIVSRDEEYDRLAEVLKSNLDIEKIEALLSLERPTHV